MAVQITAQLRTFGLSILLGLSAGVLYDLLRAIRLRRPRLTGVLDLLYCCGAISCWGHWVEPWYFSVFFPPRCGPYVRSGWTGAPNFSVCCPGRYGKVRRSRKKSSDRRKTSFILVKNTLQ